MGLGSTLMLAKRKIWKLEKLLTLKLQKIDQLSRRIELENEEFQAKAVKLTSEFLTSLLCVDQATYSDDSVRDPFMEIALIWWHLSCHDLSIYKSKLASIPGQAHSLFLFIFFTELLTSAPKNTECASGLIYIIKTDSRHLYHLIPSRVLESGSLRASSENREDVLINYHSHLSPYILINYRGRSMVVLNKVFEFIKYLLRHNHKSDHYKHIIRLQTWLVVKSVEPPCEAFRCPHDTEAF